MKESNLTNCLVVEWMIVAISLNEILHFINVLFGCLKHIITQIMMDEKQRHAMMFVLCALMKFTSGELIVHEHVTHKKTAKKDVWYSFFLLINCLFFLLMVCWYQTNTTSIV
jgi:hypothetical protein